VFSFGLRDSLEDYKRVLAALQQAFGARIVHEPVSPYSSACEIEVWGIRVFVIQDTLLGIYFYSQSAQDESITAKLALQLERELRK
jgi:hypothetical protein